MQTIMAFVTGNMAYILLAAAILYFAIFIFSIVRARKTGEGFQFRIKSFVAFLLIIGLAVYCLVTGQDLSSFIN